MSGTTGVQGATGSQGATGAQGVTGPDVYEWYGGPVYSTQVSYNSSGNTEYGPLDGTYSVNSQEQNAAESVATSGRITGFDATADISNWVGTMSPFKITFTLRDNGVSEATCSVMSSGTLQNCSATGLSITFNAGDYLDMQIQVTQGSSGTPTPGANRLGWTIYHT